MTDQIITERPRNSGRTISKPTSEAHANEVLPDAPYIAYCLMQSFRLFMSLACKRWPELRERRDHVST